MSTFQRARSSEQRAIRRQAILDGATAMLEESAASTLTLNALSRRVGLAKSNVLRYFESREEILLELLSQTWEAWLTDLAARIASEVDRSAPTEERAERLAAVITASLDAHAVFCDLLSAQAAVLEHNVSGDAAARYKRATLRSVAELADLVRGPLPELGTQAIRFSGHAMIAVSTIWTYAHPSAGALAAYDADPALASHRIEFAPALQEMLATLVAGTLARHPSPAQPGGDQPGGSSRTDDGS